MNHRQGLDGKLMLSKLYTLKGFLSTNVIFIILFARDNLFAVDATCLFFPYCFNRHLSTGFLASQNHVLVHPSSLCAPFVDSVGMLMGGRPPRAPTTWVNLSWSRVFDNFSALRVNYSSVGTIFLMIITY